MKNVLKFLGIGLMVLIIAALVLFAINSILPTGWQLTSEVFVVLAAAVLSAAWTFTPGLRVQFAALETNVKVLVNLILMILLAVLMFIFSCTGWNPIPGVVCSVDGAKALSVLVFLAIAGNQLTYIQSPEPEDVKVAKAARKIG